MRKIVDWDSDDFQKNLSEETGQNPSGNGCWWVIFMIACGWLGATKLIEFFTT